MADATTPQELTDLVSALQRQVQDLSVITDEHDQRITTNETDIAALESPVPGLPPETLEWFDSGHTTTEVDAILNDSLNTTNGAVTTNTENITVISDSLAKEVNDRSTADDALQLQTDDIQTQVTINLDTLNQEVTDRSNLSIAVSGQYDSINTRMDGIEADVSTAITSGSSAAASVAQASADMSAALQVQQTQILQLQGIGVDPAGAQASQITSLTIIANDAATATAQETIDRTNADAALQVSINALNDSLYGVQSGLAAEKSAREAEDITLETEIGALETEVSGATGAIAAETATRQAADIALQASVDANTTNISANTAAIAEEVADRTDGDTFLQAQIDTSVANIFVNTGQIATNTSDIALINTQFGVVKDVSGYVTDWQALNQLSAPGDFNLRDLNNDVRLKSPIYPGNYFPPVSVSAFSLPVSYDTSYGGATTNFFHGTDNNDYTRQIKVYATATVGLNGSVFKGVNYGTGGDLNRLGQVLTTFLVDFRGGVHRYLSVWYRIKNVPTDTTQRWYPVALADNTMPAQRTYEQTSGKVAVQISVTSDKVIEFGVTVLNTLDASISDLTGNNFIYGGSVSVMALNMVTIS